MFVEATCVTFVGLATLTILRRFEDKNDRRILRAIEVVFRDLGDRGDAITDALAEFNAIVLEVNYERRTDGERCSTWSFEVALPTDVDMVALGVALAAAASVERVQVRSIRT